VVWVGLAVFLLDGLRAPWGRPATALPSLDDGVAARPKP